MDERKVNKNEEIEIDFARLFRALISKAWLVGIGAILCGMLAFLGALFLVTPMYQSSATFYVNNGSTVSISSGDLTASRDLVDSYIVILNTRPFLKEVMDRAGVNHSYREMEEMISAEAVDGTEFLRVAVTGPNPQETERIAKAIGEALPNQINGLMKGTFARIVDSGVVPSRPHSPNKAKAARIGFVLGFVLAAGFVVIRELSDTRIRRVEDLEKISTYPVLSSIPDEEDALESYKVLRTKLLHGFRDTGNCSVIGVTSAMAGEGKSACAVNLARAMAKLGKRVLLMDCNLRRPVLAEKLSVKDQPGLSEYLAGQVGAESLLQRCGIKDIHVISSGAPQSDSVELLSSARMKQIMEVLRKYYDVIILDLADVGEVGDALVAADFADGMLLVVRQNCCKEAFLNHALSQLEFMDAKILGLVFCCSGQAGVKKSSVLREEVPDTQCVEG